MRMMAMLAGKTQPQLEDKSKGAALEAGAIEREHEGGTGLDSSFDSRFEEFQEEERPPALIDTSFLIKE
eukprot:1829170-Rhodomonas_salina.1